MPLKEEKPFAEYIGYDLGGYMYNKKYPPNPAANGGHHHGYATDNQEAFLYDVAVNLYGVKFTRNRRVNCRHTGYKPVLPELVFVFVEIWKGLA